MPVVVHPVELELISNTTQLSYPQTVDVNLNDYVQWEIKNGERLAWFAIVSKNGSHPFITLPNGEWSRLTVHVRNNAPTGEWNYKILYVLKGSNTLQTLDPKIAVKSRPLINIFIIGIPILAALIVLIARQYFIRAKIKFEK